MLTPPVCRAARGWLGWNQAQLAAAAGVSQSTVRDFETGKRTPIANNLRFMQRALEDEGIVFMVDADEGIVGLNGPTASG